MTVRKRSRRGGRDVTTTTYESEWDAEQQAIMLALLEYRSLIHEACGGYLPETTDAGNENAFKALPAHRCHKCTAIGRSRDSYQESPQSQALLYPIQYR